MVDEGSQIEQFRDAMRAEGIDIQGEIIADGKMHRAHVEGDRARSETAWYVLHRDEHPAGAFGCWKRYGRNKFNWSSKDAGEKWTPEQRRDWAQKMERQKLQREADEAKRQDAAAARAEKLWNEREDADDDHPYCKRKKCKAYGLKVGPWDVTNPDTGIVTRVSNLALLVPIRDTRKKIWSLQAIFPNDRNALHRDKDYLKDGAKFGYFYTIGTPKERIILVCEGYATGASLHEATGHAVAIAFDTGNLEEVGAILRERFPDAKIVFCSDNDRWTTSPVENPGVTYATAAAEKINGLIAIPQFKNLDTKPTDFNDLATLEGLETVRAAIQAILDYSPPKAPKEELPPWEEESAAPLEGEVMPREGAPAKAPQPDEDDDDRQLGTATDELMKNPFFEILGFDHSTYYFFHKNKQQVMEYDRSQFADSTFIELAPPIFWQRYFSGGSKKEKFDKQAATAFLMKGADSRGIYDPERLRGRGAWADESRIVYHHGDFLTVDSKRQEIGTFKSRYIYEMQRSLPLAADEPLTDEEGAQLLDLASDFRWTKAASGALLCGWLMLAPICGALRWRPHVWLSGGAGTGKAQPHSAKVLTARGWRKMGELRVGDSVTTPDSKFGKILSIYPQGNQKIYKLTFADGRSTRATGDHLWKARVKHDWRIRTTDQMADILSRNTRATVSLAIPLCQPVEILDGNKTNIQGVLHPYVLGVLLGDGSLGKEYGETGHYFSLTSFDPHIVDRVSKLLPPSTQLKEGRRGQFRFSTLDKCSKPLRVIIKDLRLLGTRSHNKFIPPAYLEASIQDRIELLKGLMDTDGTIGENGTASYCTVSPQLRDDFIRLVRSLGGVAYAAEKETTYTSKGEKKSGRIAYNISIRMQDLSIAFSLPRKLDRVPKDYQYKDCFYLNVISIENDGDEDASCIVIDHPDRLYITDDFVVTHNSTLLNDFMHPLLNGLNLFAQGNTTEAGMRQKLRTDALPILFEESEQNEEKDRTRMQHVLSLIRQSSTESHARVFKGTMGGHSMEFLVRSMFCLASIQVGIKHQADIERITVLSLRPKKDPTRDTFAEWEKLRERLYETIGRNPQIGPKLMKRAMTLLPVIKRNVEVFSTVCAKKFGSAREGDQYGALLAGTWSMSNSQVATDTDAYGLIQAYSWEEHRDAAETDESQLALAALMGNRLRAPRGMEYTVHELASAASGSPVNGVDIDKINAEVILGRYGMLVKHGYLLLSNSSVELRDIMAHTNYAADWRGVLLRIPGADRNDNKGMRFSGVASKCIRIPLEPIIKISEEAVQQSWLNADQPIER